MQTTPFGTVLALWGAGLGAAAQYAKVSVIFDQLPTIYPDAGASIGFIVSLVGMVGIVLGVAAGLLVARIRYRRALLWALWVGAGVSLLEALLPPLPLMLGLRALEGMSHLLIVVAAPTLIAQISAERHRGLTLTLWSTFFGVAFTILVFGGLPLVEAQGISALFLAHGIWMVAFALILGLTLKPLGLAPPTERLTLASLLQDHLAIYRSPRMAAPAAGWLFYTFCFLATLTVLPPYMPDGARALVLGVMPLTSIVVSMTLGVGLLRVITAIQVIQLGFGLTILSLIWLLMAPGAPVACIAWASAVGLVQGASFAAVPELNTTAETQARANGAMAQMGNLGNTIGTPALLAIMGLSGYAGLIWTTIVVFAGGILIHLWMAQRRKRIAY